MTARRPLIAGNWKMNGLSASSATLDAIIAGAAKLPGSVDVLVCPPFPLIPGFADQARGTRVAIGGQDCHPEPSGAHTGDIAAEMLADAGATAVIVGHSDGGRTIMRPTRKCAPRRLQRGALGFSPSSALVRPALSAMPEMRSSLCARSSTARCRTVPSIW